MNYRWNEPEEHPLLRYVRGRGWTEKQAMNALQEHGIVSDNAIDMQGVGNYARAMMWLHKHASQVEEHTK